MSFFNRKKSKSNNVVWRNSAGKIECPGDNCPQNCDDTCPIFLNTQAAMLIRIGENDKAIPVFEKIIAMAPDFYDAWNNLAMVYGTKGNYQKAYDCYKKAHDISPTRPAPVFGLGLSSRDLKKYDECLRWCDEYDKLANDHRLDAARREASAALGKTPASNYSSEAPYVMKLLQSGHSDGYITYPDRFPHIPEIAIQALDVSKQVWSRLFSKEYEYLKPETRIYSAFRFCFCCGMGAVALWNTDWNGLKKKGIIESLSEPRTFDNLDEYVMDLVGITWNSDEEQKLRRHIYKCIDYLITELAPHDDKAESIIIGLKAMYYYGMVMEMDRLGMH